MKSKNKVLKAGAKKASKKSMPKKEAAKMMKMLLAEKAKIFKEFKQLKETALNKSQKDASGDLSGYSYHMADMATDVYETDFILRLAADERERLYAIDDAIKRVEDGIYGQCQTCNKPISKKRLATVPETLYCLDCRQKEETQSRAKT